jgi:hypothetical protein
MQTQELRHGFVEQVKRNCRMLYSGQRLLDNPHPVGWNVREIVGYDERSTAKHLRCNYAFDFIIRESSPAAENDAVGVVDPPPAVH